MIAERRFGLQKASWCVSSILPEVRAEAIRICNCLTLRAK